MDKQDNIFTRDDGTRVLNYGRAFGDSKEAAETAAIAQAKLIEISDNLPGLAHELATQANGCYLFTKPTKNGRYVTFLNRNLGKEEKAETNHPQVVTTKPKKNQKSSKAKVA